MAQQIRIIDIYGKEYDFLIENTSKILFSNNNDGLYRKTYEDILFDAFQDLSVDTDNYDDDVLEEFSSYEIYRVLKRGWNSNLNEICQYMEKDGYKITKPKEDSYE